MGVKSISIFGDSELIIKQIKNDCQIIHPRLRAYINEVWDLVENFFKDFNIQFLPRDGNKLEDSLPMAASTFRPPINPKLRYEVEMRHMPSIPDNIKHSQIFEDDQQVKEFLAMIEDFQNTEIDQDEDEAIVGVKVSGLKNSIVNQKKKFN